VAARWRRAPGRGSRNEPDDDRIITTNWLAALERLVAAKGLPIPAALQERKEAWAEPIAAHPGKPVALLAVDSAKPELP